MGVGIKVGLVLATTIILAGICFELELMEVGGAFSFLFVVEFLLLPWLYEAFGGSWS